MLGFILYLTRSGKTKTFYLTLLGFGGLEYSGGDTKISKYIITFDKCYKGKEQVALISDNVVVTVIKKASMAGVWVPERE